LLNNLPALHNIRCRNNSIIQAWETCPCCNREIESLEHIFIHCPFNDDLRWELKQWILFSLPTIGVKYDLIIDLLDLWIPSTPQYKLQHSSFHIAPWFKGIISLYISRILCNTLGKPWFNRISLKCSEVAHEIWIRRCNWVKDSGHLWIDYPQWVKDWLDFQDDSDDFSYVIDDSNFIDSSSQNHIDHALSGVIWI